VLQTVAHSRATWQSVHVRAEAERVARAAGIPAGEVDRAVDAVVRTALSPAPSVQLNPPAPRADAELPAALRRSDGSSVYEVAGCRLYTSPAVLEAEQLLLQTAGRRDGKVVTASAVDVALLESTANGVHLNPGQLQLVRDLATSGARVQLALAPAGTGKTAAMHALAQAWRHDGGTVIGLAPSAAAAAVLREEIGAGTDTLAKLVHATRTGLDVPDWVAGIGPGTLLVVDEAGMAATPDLAHAVDHVVARGGSVRLVGDDRQLSAIGAGGVLRDIAATHGAVTLSQVLRFTHPDTGAPRHDEGAASLALRAGDPAALAYYTDHGRVHVGDPGTAADQAYTAWAADRAGGADSVMLAPTRGLVAELNARARADRLATTGGATRAEIALAGGAAASAGDTVITTLNNRRVPLGTTDWVKNGDRWSVQAVHSSGTLEVTHARTGRAVTLPADYVSEHVTLGYACTVHAAQGLSAGTAHTVATGEESRQLFYVAMTRGRHANHVYLSTAGDGDPHSLVTRDALLPPTAVNVLTRVLGRDDAPVSATTSTAQLSDPMVQLSDAGERYWHSLTTAAESRLGPHGLTRLDEAAEAAHPGLTEAAAWPSLRAHLALLAAGRTDPAQALVTALTAGPGLGDARDVAAVLDWRLDSVGSHFTGPGPLPWLPAVPDTLDAERQWGRHLHASARRVTVLAGDVAATARAWTPAAAPPWAVPMLDTDHALVADLAVWRAAHRIPDTDRRPTGPPVLGAADTRAQRALDQRVEQHLRSAHAAAAQWASLASRIDPRLITDPYWPILADRLTAAHRAGIPVQVLLRDAASAGPLPDEQPAAALWWRLHEHLSPAALDATAHTPVEAPRAVRAFRGSGRPRRRRHPGPGRRTPRRDRSHPRRPRPLRRRGPARHRTQRHPSRQAHRSRSRGRPDPHRRRHRRRHRWPERSPTRLLGPHCPRRRPPPPRPDRQQRPRRAASTARRASTARSARRRQAPIHRTRRRAHAPSGPDPHPRGAGPGRRRRHRPARNGLGTAPERAHQADRQRPRASPPRARPIRGRMVRRPPRRSRQTQRPPTQPASGHPHGPGAVGGAGRARTLGPVSRPRLGRPMRGAAARRARWRRHRRRPTSPHHPGPAPREAHRPHPGVPAAQRSSRCQRS